MNKTVKIILVVVGAILIFILIYPTYIKDGLGVNIESVPDSINGQKEYYSNENSMIIDDSLSIYKDSIDSVLFIDSITVVKKIDSLVNDYYSYADSILHQTTNLNKNVYLNYFSFINKFNIVVDSISFNIGVKTHRKDIYNVYKFKIDSVFSLNNMLSNNTIKRYNIIVETFKNESNANNYVKNLDRKYNPIIIKNNDYYLISIFGTNSLVDVDNISIWIKNNTNFKNCWVYNLK